MVIKSIAFQGTLDHNYLRISVNEHYLPISCGHWRFRIDSLYVTVKSETVSIFSVGCSLLKSPQIVNQRTVTAYAPLLVGGITKTAAGSKFPTITLLLGPGQSYWSEFNAGSTSFELSFTPISETGVLKYFDFFIAGIMVFECLG